MTKSSRQPLRHRPRRNQPGWCGWCNKRHRTRGDAKDVIHRMRRSSVSDDHPKAYMGLQAYHCPTSPGWHIGHSHKLMPPAIPYEKRA